MKTQSPEPETLPLANSTNRSAKPRPAATPLTRQKAAATQVLKPSVVTRNSATLLKRSVGEPASSFCQDHTNTPHSTAVPAPGAISLQTAASMLTCLTHPSV